MSARLTDCWARLADRGRTAFIPYVTAGDPDLSTTGAILDALVAAGADIIELGIPFSDPMADGPVIQAAMGRALGAGATLAKVLTVVRDFRSRQPDTPLILFGYFNPLYQYGLARVVAEAREAGADGFLVVDLPPEEAAELTAHTAPADLDFITLFTPTSDDDRVRAIATHASGFAYYVSQAAITGDAIANFDLVAGRAARVREITQLPVAVGFGIQSGADAARVATFADGVVVGSALVRAIHDAGAAGAAAAAGALTAELRAAIDAVDAS